MICRLVQIFYFPPREGSLIFKPTCAYRNLPIKGAYPNKGTPFGLKEANAIINGQKST